MEKRKKIGSTEGNETIEKRKWDVQNIKRTERMK